MYVYIVIARRSRDVWTRDAALVGGGSETSGLATQIVWGVGAETFVFDAALEGRGTETDCTSDAAYVYIYICIRRCGVYGLAICYHRIVFVVFV